MMVRDNNRNEELCLHENIIGVVATSSRSTMLLWYYNNIRYDNLERSSICQSFNKITDTASTEFVLRS
jgi:hypothetical protein